MYTRTYVLPPSHQSFFIFFNQVAIVKGSGGYIAQGLHLKKSKSDKRAHLHTLSAYKLQKNTHSFSVSKWGSHLKIVVATNILNKVENIVLLRNQCSFFLLLIIKDETTMTTMIVTQLICKYICSTRFSLSLPNKTTENSQIKRKRYQKYQPPPHNHPNRQLNKKTCAHDVSVWITVWFPIPKRSPERKKMSVIFLSAFSSIQKIYTHKISYYTSSNKNLYQQLFLLLKKSQIHHLPRHPKNKWCKNWTKIDKPFIIDLCVFYLKGKSFKKKILTECHSPTHITKTMHLEYLMHHHHYPWPHHRHNNT